MKTNKSDFSKDKFKVELSPTDGGCCYRGCDGLRPVPLLLQHPRQVRLQADPGELGGGEWIQQVPGQCELQRFPAGQVEHL